MRILGLTALTLLSLLPLTKPTPPALSTQFFTQQMQTAVYPNGMTPTSSPFFFVWNFTENLTGRDVGSTQVRFLITQILNPVSVMSDSNLTSLTSQVSPSCFTSAGLPSCLTLLFTTQLEKSYDMGYIGAGWALSSGFAGNVVSLIFRPSSSGSYHIVFLAPNVSNIQVGEIRGYETWTVTTIS